MRRWPGRLIRDCVVLIADIVRRKTVHVQPQVNNFPQFYIFSSSVSFIIHVQPQVTPPLPIHPHKPSIDSDPAHPCT